MNSESRLSLIANSERMQTHRELITGTLLEIKEKHKGVEIRDLSWASESMVLFLFLVSIFSGNRTSRLAAYGAQSPEAFW